MADAEEPTKVAHDALRTEGFSFIVRPGEEISVGEAVFQGLGAASMCWSEPPVGLFKSTRCKEIGDAIMELIRDREHPNLGLATTQELLKELEARLSVNQNTPAASALTHVRKAYSALTPKLLRYRTVDIDATE